MQTEFLLDRARAQIGQKVDATACTIVSAASNSEIPFGALVVYDDSDAFLCKLPMNATEISKPLGITLRQLHCEQYQRKSSIAVLRKGRVWIEADKAHAPGDPVYVKFVDNMLAQFTGEKENNALLFGAIFLEKSDGGLVPIEVNFFGGVQ